MARKILGALVLSIVLVVAAWFATRSGPPPSPRDPDRTVTEVPDRPTPEFPEETPPEEVTTSGGSTLDLGLGPASIHGVITGPDGGPRAGAEVVLHRSGLPTDIEEDGTIALPRLVDLRSGSENAVRSWRETGRFPFRAEVRGGLSRVAAVTTDDAGGYRFDGLESATYLVSGRSDGTLVTPGRSVEHVEGEEHRVDIGLLEAGTLSGYVVGEDGSTVSEAEVRILGEIVPFDEGFDAMVLGRDEVLLYLLNPISGSMAVDAEGNFSFGGLPFLDYRVVVDCDDWANAEKLHPVPEPAPLEVVLEAGGTIEGVVLDEAGMPVAGIEVALEAEGARRLTEQLTTARPTTTARDGSFRFRGLAPETYRITASGPGWQSASENGLLVESGGTREVELVVEQGARLRGTVLDDDGNPLGEVRVTAREISEGDGRQRNRGTVITAADGSFTFDTIPPGDYVVRGDREGWLQAEVEAETDAAPVELVMERGALVTGRVVGPDEAPLPRAWIEIPRGWNDAVRHEVDAEGAFSFHVSAEGALTLVARCRGHAEVAVEIPEGGGDAGTIALPESVRIEGLVIGPDGQPLPGARVVASRPDSVRTERWRAATRTETVWSDADGVFSVEADAPDAVYSLVARAPGLLPSEAVEVALAGTTVSGVTLSLRWGAQVSGFVTGPTNLPIEGALVEFRQKNVRGRGLRSNARTNADGEYTIGGLRAGEYSVRASAPRHASSSIPEVALGEDEVRRVDLRLGPELRFTGVVIDRTGLAIAGARVSVSEVGAGRRTSTTDPDGEFVVDRLGTGELRVTITAEGFLRARENDLYASDGPLEFVLDPAYSIVGVVTDITTGEPIRRARARAMPSEGNRRGGRWVRSDNLGRFEIADLAEGDYTLEVTASGFIPFSAPEIRLPSRGADEEFVVALRAGGRVRGRVLDAFGRELQGADVSAHPLGDDVGDEIPAPRGRPAARDRTKEDGTFTLVGLENGRYSLTFSHSEHLVERRSVIVDVDRSEPWVTVNLERGGVIEGNAYLPNGAAADSGAVRIAGATSRRQRMRSGDPGRFRFAGLPPGNYTVTFHPDARSRDVTATVEIELPPRGSRSIDLHSH